MKPIFELNKRKILFKVKPNKTLRHGQTLAILLDNSYRTKTGGIITYGLAKLMQTKKKH